MIIATFNCNSVRARLPIVSDWLTTHQPDVLCLQETKVVDEDFPWEAFDVLGYHAAYCGEKSYNGVAIISRKKPDIVRFGFDDDGPADTTRLAYARVDGAHIVNTYIPQGREIDHEMYQYKLQWLARLRAWFDHHLSTRRRVVWTGDMNVAPAPIDIHNSEKQANHVCFHTDVRQAYAQTVAWGFTDVYRAQHPEEPAYTFFDYRTPNAAQRNMGWRIDHIMCTPPMARRCTKTWIDIEPRLKPKPSDHTFLVAEFA